MSPFGSGLYFIPARWLAHAPVTYIRRFTMKRLTKKMTLHELIEVLKEQGTKFPKELLPDENGIITCAKRSNIRTLNTKAIAVKVDHFEADERMRFTVHAMSESMIKKLFKNFVVTTTYVERDFIGLVDVEVI